MLENLTIKFRRKRFSLNHIFRTKHLLLALKFSPNLTLKLDSIYILKVKAISIANNFIIGPRIKI
jgi:hypothetical protein